MNDLSPTAPEPSRSLPQVVAATGTSSTPSALAVAAMAGARTCIVCGKKFAARRPEARACSGRCRMHASRARRVGDLVARIEAAERALADAHVALAALRELADIGSSRVMP